MTLDKDTKKKINELEEHSIPTEKEFKKEIKKLEKTEKKFKKKFFK